MGPLQRYSNRKILLKNQDSQSGSGITVFCFRTSINAKYKCQILLLYGGVEGLE
jgi:hypothetical protein